MALQMTDYRRLVLYIGEGYPTCMCGTIVVIPNRLLRPDLNRRTSCVRQFAEVPVGVATAPLVLLGASL